MRKVERGAIARVQALAWGVGDFWTVVRTEEAVSRRCRWIYRENGAGRCLTCGEVKARLEDEDDGLDADLPGGSPHTPGRIDSGTGEVR